jgi:hypothetical protein
MAAGLARAAEDGLAAYLETATASNAALYERSGWRSAGSCTVEGLTVQVMKHPAGG